MAMMRSYSWEAKYPGADVELRKLHADNVMCSEIAAFLSGKYNARITRGSVIGRLHRMGLFTDKKERSRRLSISQREHYRRHPRPSLIARRKQGSEKPKNILPNEWLPKEPMTLMQLGARNCRWPFGTPGQPDFCFCGRAEADMAADPTIPYCREHMAMHPAPKQPARRGLGTFHERDDARKRRPGRYRGAPLSGR